MTFLRQGVSAADLPVPQKYVGHEDLAHNKAFVASLLSVLLML